MLNTLCRYKVYIILFFCFHINTQVKNVQIQIFFVNERLMNKKQFLVET